MMLALLLAGVELPPVQVIASRLPAPAPAIVLSGDALAGPGTLAQALAQVPQLYVPQPGGRSGFAGPQLDGADPNFTLVLLDGVPLNNATSSRGGAVNLHEISSLGISRVEVQPAQLSAVHGSGALAGVIALQLPLPEAQGRFTAALGGISRGGASAAAGWQGGLAGRWRAQVQGEWADDGQPTPLTGFRQRGGLLRLVKDDGGDRLLLRFNSIDSQGFPDGSGGARLAVRRQAEQRAGQEWLAALRTRQPLAPGLLLDVNASWLGRHDRVDNPGVAAPPGGQGLPGSSGTTRYDRLLGQASLALSRPGWQLALGAEAGQERGRDTSRLLFGSFALPTAFLLQRTSWAGFAELAGQQGAASATAALRVDAIGDLAPRLSARLAARWQLAPGWQLAASAGSSFKAPSFYALANPLVGNPALAPERGRRADVALLWTQPGTTLRLGGFASEYKGLIDFVFQPVPRLINRGRLAVPGVFASLAQDVAPGLSFDLSVQHIWPRDPAGAPLLLRPRWRANAALHWAVDARLRINARLGQVGARLDESLPGGAERLAPYLLAGADARWQASPALAVTLAVDNALDARFEDAAGFPGAPLRLRAGVVAGF
jgi:outer membrane cobalamin receptor